MLSSEEFASGDAAGALAAGFLATDRAYLLSGAEEEGEAAAEAELSASKSKKVLVKVKSIFHKGERKGSGEIDGSGLGLSPPSASCLAAAAAARAREPPSSSSSGEGSGSGRNAGAAAAAAAAAASSSSSAPSTPTEEAPAGLAARLAGGPGAGGTPPPAPPRAPPLSTPSPSRRMAPARDDGCTAAVALVLGDDRLLVAHVGDSRAVLVEPVPVPEEEGKRKKEGSWRGGGRKSDQQPPPPTAAAATQTPAFSARALSTDHKPNRPDERARIEAAGGTVLWAGTWRVGGVLAVSRAFWRLGAQADLGHRRRPGRPGRRLKKTPPPSSNSSSSSFAPLLILATDGVWDALTTEEAASIALSHREDLEEAARVLTREAWERGSADNATAVVVRLGAPK